MRRSEYDILVIGGGHAGAEAAWTAGTMGCATAMITMDAGRIGAMSCNPAIGGLAKGQMVREIDALGGLMGLAADATGIQFKVLNGSKGPAVRGPRCQSDKYAYAREVQRLLRTRSNLDLLAGEVVEIVVENGKCAGVIFQPAVIEPERTHLGMDCCNEFERCGGPREAEDEKPRLIRAAAVVLTTGTFMRALMHTGESKTAGGRIGEASAEGISGNLARLGFDLGRLKTGTPPRLARESLDLDSLEPQPGDAIPTPFSELSGAGLASWRFPVMPQVHCWITRTAEPTHQLIRDNLHLAPMYNGQIETAGPRYCPSIEDKVVRFADKSSHQVFLEPESLETNEIYCNGISTSLPRDIQQLIVRALPGCGRAKILKYGYAVEYDMVWPHQIDATAMTKLVPGLFLAGQINGTSGYEEAAGQGQIAGINAVLYSRGQEPLRLNRDQAYIGVLMDDLVTKTPREPYRMFTSRAEHRLILRSDNAADRLTPLGRQLGLVDDHRWSIFQRRQQAIAAIEHRLATQSYQGARLIDWLRRPEIDEQWLADRLAEGAPGGNPAAAPDRRLLGAILSRAMYEPFVERHRRQHDQIARMESRTLPRSMDYTLVTGLRNEARNALSKFRPATLGQAGRLAGITPADLTVLVFALDKR